MKGRTLDKKKIERETRTKLQNAIKFLAPWFGLTVEEAVNKSKAQRLTLRLVDSLRGGPACHPFIPLIELPYEPEEDRGDFMIAHELGHWYYNLINREVYVLGSEVKNRRGIYKPYNEAIANYAGIIFENKANPIQPVDFFDDWVSKDFFDLSNLVRLNTDEINENRYYLRYFFRDILAPHIPNREVRDSFLELVNQF